MIKIIHLVVVFIVFMSPVCFADDIFIGNDDNTAVYLRTESIKANSTIIQGMSMTTIVVTYKTIGVPDPDELDKLKKICLDNNISHSEKSYKVLLHYDRIKNVFSDETPYVSMENSTLNNSSNKVLFNEHNSSRFICSLGSTNPRHEIHKLTYEQVAEYIKANNIITYTYK